LEGGYGRKAPAAASWYCPHLERSLAFSERAGLDRGEGILDDDDAFALVDDLPDRGYRDLAVLDISATPIDRVKTRLGARAGAVTWLVGDITRVMLPERRFAFRNDRAVFHLLTAPDAHRAYVAAVSRALRVHGHIVVATFGPGGPEQCSGLDSYGMTPIRCTANSATPLTRSTVAQNTTRPCGEPKRNLSTATAGCNRRYPVHA
jgi:SAM-dependent methyltransferase